MIERKPERLQTVIHTRPSKPNRYVRYIGPKDGHCNIAKAAFYMPGDTVPLKGKVIGTSGCAQKDSSHEYTNVFDGDFGTSFDYQEPVVVCGTNSLHHLTWLRVKPKKGDKVLIRIVETDRVSPILTTKDCDRNEMKERYEQLKVALQEKGLI